MRSTIIIALTAITAFALMVYIWRTPQGAQPMPVSYLPATEGQ